MMSQVHYLIRDPQHPESYIYPSELPLSELPYMGFGSFYLISSENSIDDGNYIFPAIHGEQVLQIRIAREGNKKTVFVAVVEGIGEFKFRSFEIQNPPDYIGKNPDQIQNKIVRKLKPNDPQVLDDAVRNHNFYFVGYSPLLNDQ